MRSFATCGASRATGGRPGDDDGHDPFGDCTSSGWEGTEGADADAGCWQRGELDLSSFRLTPGRSSPYMQQNYRGLYEHEWAQA